MNPDKKPLGPWFWLILFTPAALILMTMNTALNSNNVATVFAALAVLALAVLAAALYCGFRLGYYWLQGKASAPVVGLLISLGLLAAYAAVFFFGCLAFVSSNL